MEGQFEEAMHYGLTNLHHLHFELAHVAIVLDQLGLLPTKSRLVNYYVKSEDYRQQTTQDAILSQLKNCIEIEKIIFSVFDFYEFGFRGGKERLFSTIFMLQDEELKSLAIAQYINKTRDFSMMLDDRNDDTRYLFNFPSNNKVTLKQLIG